MRQLTKTVLRAVLLIVALTFSCASVTRVADAATPAERKLAGEHFGRGKELFDEGDYQGALVEFERAYELAPNWRVLFNIGQVKYQLQDYPGAMLSLEQYLKEGGAKIPADRRGQVLSDIERLRSRVAYVKIEVNEAGATVTVDDRPIGVSPLSKAVAVSAGRRKITATADGAPPATKFVALAGGDSSDVSLEIVRPTAPTPTPTPTPDPGTEPDTGSSGPWVAWGVTAGFGVGTLVLGILALNAASDFDDAAAGETTKDDLESARSKVLGFSISADVFLAATVIAAGISIYVTVDAATSDEEDPASGEVGVRLFPGGAALEGSF